MFSNIRRDPKWFDDRKFNFTLICQQTDIFWMGVNARDKADKKENS